MEIGYPTQTQAGLLPLEGPITAGTVRISSLELKEAVKLRVSKNGTRPIFPIYRSEEQYCRNKYVSPPLLLRRQ